MSPKPHREASTKEILHHSKCATRAPHHASARSTRAGKSPHQEPVVGTHLRHLLSSQPPKTRTSHTSPNLPPSEHLGTWLAHAAGSLQPAPQPPRLSSPSPGARDELAIDCAPHPPRPLPALPRAPGSWSGVRLSIEPTERDDGVWKIARTKP